MTDLNPTAGTFTGRHMWMLAVGFFGIIIAVNVGMAVIASTSWTGLVVDNAYVASQQFDARRDAQKGQQALGWEANFTYTPGLARLTIHDGAGKPVDLGTVHLQVNRPVGGHEDQKLDFVPSPSGGYEAVITIAGGIWDIWVTAEKTAAGPFELHERFKVKVTP
ncbi:FixH family protein [Devosia sp.]|uniref:FixH family protein n=1 Tax=Devosia sp. TaxID=1871048 RepID=UPI003BA89BEF